MIKSMTGYGSAKATVEGLDISIELKSVNNRFLDSSVRLPRSFLFLEDKIKSLVQAHISRGKVDVYLSVDSSAAGEMTVKVNEALLQGYLDALAYIGQRFGLPNDASVMRVSRFPDVLTVEKKDLDADAILAGITPVVEAALVDFDDMRQREGERLKQDVLSRLDSIERMVSFVEEQAPQTVADYRSRLEQKMAEVLGSTGIEEGRILAEAAVFADRVAVDEETVRLRSHISQLRTMLSGASPIGRKIDFLIQEFNREANTIGSKCQNSQITEVVVELKAEIEKIREQIQNIE